MDDRQNKIMKEILPVLFFLGVYFLLQLFEWEETSRYLLAAFSGLMAYLFMVADFNQKFKDEKIFGKQQKQLKFYSGLLTLLWGVFLVQTVLHWQKIFAKSWRMAFMYLVLIVFVTVLIRAGRVLQTFKLANKSK
jgi:type IV secretory pathway VirB6-like protein